jgi:hypothetical protein
MRQIIFGNFIDQTKVSKVYELYFCFQFTHMNDIWADMAK